MNYLIDNLTGKGEIKMAKYDEIFETVKNFSPERIIKEFELNLYQVEMMKYLYMKQPIKEQVIEMYSHLLSKKEISKLLGDLKRKGLIYSVVGLPGYIGTEIKLSH